MTKEQIRLEIARKTKGFLKSQAIEVLEPQENGKVIVKSRRAYDPTVDRSTNRKPKMGVRIARPDEAFQASQKARVA